jgi:hypothetical protein
MLSAPRSLRSLTDAGLQCPRWAEVLKILGEIAVLAHFVGDPEHALVVDQKAAAAVFVTALDVFDRANQLFLAAETVAYAHALRGKNGGAGVVSGARAGGKQKLAAIVMAELAVFFNFLRRVTEHAECFRDPVDGDSEFQGPVEKSGDRIRGIDGGAFNAEVRAVGESLV